MFIALKVEESSHVDGRSFKHLAGDTFSYEEFAAN